MSRGTQKRGKRGKKEETEGTGDEAWQHDVKFEERVRTCNKVAKYGCPKAKHLGRYLYLVHPSLSRTCPYHTTYTFLTCILARFCEIKESAEPLILASLFTL